MIKVRVKFPEGVQEIKGEVHTYEQGGIRKGRAGRSMIRPVTMEGWVFRQVLGQSNYEWVAHRVPS